MVGETQSDEQRYGDVATKLRARIQTLEERNVVLERFAAKLCDDDPTTSETLDHWATEYLHAMSKLGGCEEREARIQTLEADLLSAFDRGYKQGVADDAEWLERQALDEKGDKGG